MQGNWANWCIRKGPNGGIYCQSALSTDSKERSVLRRPRSICMAQIVKLRLRRATQGFQT